MIKPNPLPEACIPRLLELDIDIVQGKVYGKYHTELGGLSGTPYIRIAVNAGIKSVLLKRANIISWKATGKWPDTILDHKDRNKLNDSFSNLEPITATGNALNKNDMPRKSELPRGVYRSRGTVNRVYARIMVRGKYEYLGNFDTPEEASKVYEARRLELLTFERNLP